MLLDCCSSSSSLIFITKTLIRVVSTGSRVTVTGTREECFNSNYDVVMSDLFLYIYIIPSSCTCNNSNQ